MLAVIALVLAPIPLTRVRRRAQVASTRNDTRVRSLRPQAALDQEPAWR
jgi:hypothetical protein